MGTNWLDYSAYDMLILYERNGIRQTKIPVRQFKDGCEQVDI